MDQVDRTNLNNQRRAGVDEPISYLDDIITHWANASPDDVALIVDDQRVTVAELARLVDQVARALRRHTTPGGTVSVLGSNSVEFVALLYAVPAAGRILAPLNIRHAPIELAEQLRRCQAEVVFGTTGELDRVLGDNDTPDSASPSAGRTSPSQDDATSRLVQVCLDGGTTHHWVGLGEFLKADSPAAFPPNTAESDPTAPGGHRAVDATPERTADTTAWLIFTSGTTGPPKGALLTRASLLAGVATTAAGRPFAHDDVYLYPFPLYHVSAYNVLHAHQRRRPVVLLPRFDARTIIELARANDVTAMSLAPTMLRMILDDLAANGDAGQAMPSLRTINYGAAAMPETLLREASETLGCGFAQGYGMTELSGNAVFLGPEHHRRGLAATAADASRPDDRRFLHAAGYAGDGVQLRLIDDHGVEVGHGTPGEVTVRGAQVCAGYLDDERATRSAIVDGWLHTGDVGVLDQDGLLHIVDRSKDLVVTGGENVSSREVEDALLTHPLVAQAAVIALPDDRWGEAVTAVVVLRSGADVVGAAPRSDGSAEDSLLDDFRAHVGDQLAGYKKPRRVFVVDALPINAGGKVDKRRLRDALG